MELGERTVAVITGAASGSEIVARRFDRIEEGLDRAPVEQLPGMPPHSQIVDEIMAALANGGTT